MLIWANEFFFFCLFLFFLVSRYAWVQTEGKEIKKSFEIFYSPTSLFSQHLHFTHTYIYYWLSMIINRKLLLFSLMVNMLPFVMLVPIHQLVKNSVFVDANKGHSFDHTSEWFMCNRTEYKYLFLSCGLTENKNIRTIDGLIISSCCRNFSLQ